MKLIPCSPRSCAPAFSGSRSGLDAFFRSPFSGLQPFFEMAQASSTPRLAVDVYEDDAAYSVVMEVPGVKKEDVKVDLTDNTLSVTAERKFTTDDGEVSRSYGRSLTLARDVAKDQISAKLEDGVLTLTLPKAPEARARSIAIA